MFYTVFKENPMSPEEGRRYRYMVLEKGGGQDEMKTLVDFLGREPKTEAFYREIGLAWYLWALEGRRRGKSLDRKNQSSLHYVIINYVFFQNNLIMESIMFQP